MRDWYSAKGHWSGLDFEDRVALIPQRMEATKDSNPEMYANWQGFIQFCKEWYLDEMRRLPRTFESIFNVNIPLETKGTYRVALGPNKRPDNAT